jgi:hypothetical protein
MPGRQPDRLAFGVAVGRAAVRQESVVPIGPEQAVELILALGLAAAEDHPSTTAVRLLQQPGQRLIEAASVR